MNKFCSYLHRSQSKQFHESGKWDIHHGKSHPKNNCSCSASGDSLVQPCADSFFNIHPFAINTFFSPQLFTGISAPCSPQKMKTTGAIGFLSWIMTSPSKSRKCNRRKITSQGLGFGFVSFFLIGCFEYLDSLKAHQKAEKDTTLIAAARKLFGLFFSFCLVQEKRVGLN